MGQANKLIQTQKRDAGCNRNSAQLRWQCL